MRPYTYHQDELNRAMVQGLRETGQRLAETIELLGEARAQLRDAGLLDGPWRTHLRRMIEGSLARPSPDDPLISNLDERGRSVLRFEGAADGADRAELYRAFEDVFRGGEHLIRERQKPYLELFRHASWVLDVGCGRGEFLDLLREHEGRGKGIDSDEGMVTRCREKGLDVELADALEFLRGREDGSIPAAFSAQVIEHLPFEVLTELLELLRAKLVPGGLAVLETVNPHCPRALKAFWVDPTHEHPLFPEVVLARGRLAGFAGGEVVFPGAADDPETAVYESPDYAVVLRTATG
jgi:SAM-dependent methyltransferase